MTNESTPATRMGIVAAIVEEWSPAHDGLDVILDRWALIQYNGGRAPSEKWLALFHSSEAACDYAANDEEWEPEAIVDLDSGEVWAVERLVTLTTVERTLTPAEPDDDIAEPIG